MFEDDIYKEDTNTEEGQSLTALMEKRGLVKPVLNETSKIIEKEDDLEEKRESFLTRKFKSSPASVLQDILESRGDENIKKKEISILKKYNDMDINGRKKFLEHIHGIYKTQRIEMYNLINLLAKENQNDSQNEILAKKISDLSESNIVLREVVQNIGIKIYQFTGMAKYNEFFGKGLLLSLSYFSFNRGINIICPQCGKFVETKVIDLHNHYHQFATPFILNTHGKLLQDCDSCNWYFLYDLDILTNFPDLKLILSEEPKIKIANASASHISIGETSSKRYIHFLMPLNEGDNRELYLKRLKGILGTKKMIQGIKNNENGFIDFNSKVFELKESEKTVVGISLGLVINNHVVVKLFFRE